MENRNEDNVIKGLINNVWKGLLILVGGIVLGFVALALVHLIPVDKMYQNMCYVFLIIGMATSYVDFLTYPFVSLGIPLVIWLILDNEEKVIQKLGKMVWNSGFWCAGYAGMWAGKWILGSILLPEAGSLKAALESISY